MKRVLILHLIVNLGSGGAERCLFNVAIGSDAATFEHTVISLMGDGVYGSRLRDAGVRVQTLGLDRGQLSLTALLRIWRVVREIRPDVIQTWMSHADLIGGIVGKLCHVPVIWNVRHGSLDAELNKRSSLLVVRACAAVSRVVPHSIVFCSEAASKLYAAHGYFARKILVIPNGVDTAYFAPDSAGRVAKRKELDIPGKSPVVGLIARYDRLKDHRTFVRASALVRQALPDAYFAMAGAGVTWENHELAGLIDSLGLRAQYRLLGQRGDVRELLSSLDVLCSSSISEGFPNVIAEAMACGVPCVATNVGESANIVGEAGSLVDAGSAPDLAAALLQQLRLDSRQKRQVSRDVIDRITNRFSLRSMIHRYEALYRHAAGDQCI